MNTRPSFTGLAGRFKDAVDRFGPRPALDLNGRKFTYTELGGVVGALARNLASVSASVGPVAIFARRGLAAYAGILAAWITGKTCVPLNPKFPGKRTRQMLEVSGSEVLLVDEDCKSSLAEVLDGLARPLTIYGPEGGPWSDLPDRFPTHRFVTFGRPLENSAPLQVPELDPQAPALIVFTSGSTGVPKGVPTSHHNLDEYIRNIGSLIGLVENDRVSQAYDLTFDPVIHDLFTCWTAGACLVLVPDNSVMAPAKIIREKYLTVWFSVPSVIGFMRRMGLLKPGAFPTLRRSLFCGEPLPAESVLAWRKAAPSSTVENLYGPTETTVILTRYKWMDGLSASQCVNGLTPIGWPLPEQQARVCDAEGRAVPTGQCGELYLAGPQVVGRYWQDEELTTRKFVRLADTGGELWYRTGDLARQDETGCLYFLGRIDDQVKVRGYRIELQEVDFVLRRIVQDDQATTVAWPLRDGHAEGLVAFVRSSVRTGEQEILDRMREALPEYMVPRKIRQVPDFPLNANGKIDRRKLVSMLKEECHVHA
ncbi:MAG: AMP-binding protein [Planctomycetes bacterium]|nr:AMP-binding protein [Planctomycetota bacterium]